MSANKSYEKFLLGGEWLPVTSTVLFINATIDRTVDEFINGVRGEYLRNRFGYSPFTSRPVQAHSLDGLFEVLLPLEIPEERRMLFLPTANLGWTAMVTSAWRGLDAQSPMAWFAQGRLESVAVTEVPHEPRLPGRKRSYGERKIEMYEIPPSGEPIGRTLGVRYADKWEVAGGRNEFSIGNVWDPEARRVPNRFTHEHLVEMTARMGLRPFDEDFYAPDSIGILVERTDPLPKRWPIISLAQARGDEPIDL